MSTVALHTFPGQTASGPVMLAFAAAFFTAGAAFANENSIDARNAVLALQDVEHRLTAAIVNCVGMYVPEGAAITIRFHSGGKLAASSGVNRYCGGIELMPDGAFGWDAHSFVSTRADGELTTSGFWQ